MSILELNTGSLYIMSGLPGSGKSTALSNLQLPEGTIISSDALRRQLYGTRTYEDERGVEHLYLHGWGKPGQEVFELMRRMVRMRLLEHLTTFVDATFLNDMVRDDFALIAQECGVPYEVLIFDVPLNELLRRDSLRSACVGEDVIRKMLPGFTKTSKHPHRTIYPSDTLALRTPTLQSDALDIIGDTHGLYMDTLALIKRLGYNNVEDVPTHPRGRKLVFLGDVVDRGVDSISMLRYTERCVRNGHFMVLGNHEDKLLRTWDMWRTKGVSKCRSLSNAQTFCDLRSLSMAEQIKLMTFIRRLPHCLYVESNGYNFAIAHADIIHLDPLLTPRSVFIYGEGNHGSFNSDRQYELNVKKGFNKWRLIRGHIPKTDDVENVVSLEFQQAFAGDLAAMPLDLYAQDLAMLGSRRALNVHIIKQHCTFNFDEHCIDHYRVANAMGAYIKKGVVQTNIQESTGFIMYNLVDIQPLLETKHVKKVEHSEHPMALYKYGKSVFYDNLWGHHPFLKKARGLVLDMAGNIIQHPFDKIFNYGENGTALNIVDSTPVEAVEKINGFLACITKHPYEPENLLVTTTGSFDSVFVNYIKDFLDVTTKQKLISYFDEFEKTCAGSITLMFEVVHPRDNEHPVQYKEEDQGLWLIGARGKQWDSAMESEDYLDWVGAELNLKRPNRYHTTFGEVRQWAKTNELEGYIVLLNGEPLVKFKTTNYLAVKFVGRLSENNIDFMYKNPDMFKTKLDEEYVPMVDALFKLCPTASDYKKLNRAERMEIVRTSVNELRQSQENFNMTI